MKADIFYKKLIESAIGNIAKYGLNLLFPYVVAKLYGTTALGNFTYGYSIIMLTILFAAMGLDMGLLYFIPKEGNKYVSASFLINLIFSLVIIGVLFFIFDEPTVRMMLPLLWLLSAEQLFFTLFRVNQQIKEFFFINSFVGFVLRILLSYIFFYAFGSEIHYVILATYLSTLFSIIIYFILQRKMFGKFHISRELIFYSLPLIVGSIMSVLMSNVDMIMIGNMIGKDEVGIYRVSADIALIPAMFLVILNTVFPPIIAKLYHERKMEELGRIYKKSARILAVSSGVIILIIIIFRKSILGLYGEEFLVGDKVIIYRGIGQLVNASVGSVWYLVSMTGRPRVNMLGKMSAAIINVVLNIIFIPLHGISGAAFASMITIIFVNILGYFIVKRILKVKVFLIV